MKLLKLHSHHSGKFISVNILIGINKYSFDYVVGRNATNFSKATWHNSFIQTYRLPV